MKQPSMIMKKSTTAPTRRYTIHGCMWYRPSLGQTADEAVDCRNNVGVEGVVVFVVVASILVVVVVVVVVTGVIGDTRVQSRTEGK